jgi:hypothetical protein
MLYDALESPANLLISGTHTEAAGTKSDKKQQNSMAVRKDVLKWIQND